LANPSLTNTEFNRYP